MYVCVCVGACVGGWGWMDEGGVVWICGWVRATFLRAARRAVALRHVWYFSSTGREPSNDCAKDKGNRQLTPT